MANYVLYNIFLLLLKWRYAWFNYIFYRIYFIYSTPCVVVNIDRARAINNIAKFIIKFINCAFVFDSIYIMHLFICLV